MLYHLLVEGPHHAPLAGSSQALQPGRTLALRAATVLWRIDEAAGGAWGPMPLAAVEGER